MTTDLKTSPATAKQYKFRFLLRHGGHENEDGVQYKARVPGVPATMVNNNIVESDIDLVKRFGSEKFMKLEAGSMPEQLETGGRQLGDMTVAELRELAESMDIPLEGVTKKSDIISILRDE